MSQTGNRPGVISLISKIAAWVALVVGVLYLLLGMTITVEKSPRFRRIPIGPLRARGERQVGRSAMLVASRVKQQNRSRPFGEYRSATEGQYQIHTFQDFGMTSCWPT